MSVPRFDNDVNGPRLGSVKGALAMGLMAAILAAVVSFFLPNYYRSEARILPADSKASGGLGQLAAAAAAFGVGVPGADSGDANFVDILGSRTVLEDVLKAEYTFGYQSWRFGPMETRRQTLYDFLGARNVDRGLKRLGEVISVSRDLKSKIIIVRAETRSPELSQLVVERATAGLETFVQQKGRTRGSEKARFAQARLRESREEMAQAEEAFRRFLEGNRNYQTSPDPTVRLQGSRLEAELKLRQQLVMTLALNLETALLEEKNDVPVVNILDAASLPVDKSSPGRTLIVLLTFLGASAGAWGWLERRWIGASLLAEPEQTAGPNKEFA